MKENTIGERIAYLRKKRNFTQKDLASFLGVTDKAVSRWEAGYGNPDITILPKLAKLFDTTTDYLLSGNEGAKDELDSNSTIKPIVNHGEPKRTLMTLSKVFTILGAVGIVVTLLLFALFDKTGTRYIYLNIAVVLIPVYLLVCLGVFDSLNRGKNKNDVIPAGVLSVFTGLIISAIFIFSIPSKEFYKPETIYEENPLKNGGKKSNIKTLVGISLILIGFACSIASIIMFSAPFFSSWGNNPSVTGYQVIFDFKNCYPSLFSTHRFNGSYVSLLVAFLFLIVDALLSLVYGLIWISSLFNNKQTNRISFKTVIAFGTFQIIMGWVIGILINSTPRYTQFASFGIAKAPGLIISTILGIIGGNLSGIGFMIPLGKIKRKPAL